MRSTASSTGSRIQSLVVVPPLDCERYYSHQRKAISPIESAALQLATLLGIEHVQNTRAGLAPLTTLRETGSPGRRSFNIPSPVTKSEQKLKSLSRDRLLCGNIAEVANPRLRKEESRCETWLCCTLLASLGAAAQDTKTLLIDMPDSKDPVKIVSVREGATELKSNGKQYPNP
jgi:hypothetical protein